MMLANTTAGSHQGRIGAAGEMAVIADLLQHGYEVYRAVSPQADNDLVADIEGELYRIEVKSTSRDGHGNPRSADNYKHKQYDILAIVDPATKSIRYDMLRFDKDLARLSTLPFPRLPFREQLTLELAAIHKGTALMLERDPAKLMQELHPMDIDDIRTKAARGREILDRLIDVLGQTGEGDGE